jgi:hypothetical protein
MLKHRSAYSKQFISKLFLLNYVIITTVGIHNETIESPIADFGLLIAELEGNEAD